MCCGSTEIFRNETLYVGFSPVPAWRMSMTTKKQRSKRRSYTKEFKEEAAKMVVDQGMKNSEVAKDLGVNPNVLSRWVLQYQANGGDAFPGKGRLAPEQQRIRDLEKQLKRVTQEREILKKAIAYFAEVPK